jgi:putative mRNA 3-end processing factor
MMLLLKDRGHTVWLDGMAKEVVKIFLQNPEYLRNKKELQRALDAVKVIHSNHGRKQALKGDVIITTSGMLDGGPVLFYLETLHKDPKSSILLSGYQVERSNGRMLLDTGHIMLRGSKVKVECRVQRFDFSAHAGHADLVKFAKDSGAKDVVLFHGDQPEQLRKDLEKFTNVHIPEIGETLSFRD